jgi:peptide/nickel transport system substrate-binding protein
MRRHHSFHFAIALALLAGGCGKQTDDSPLSVSVIGGRLLSIDPNAGPLDPAQAVLLSATTQGLVRYDGSGQIEPGLAIRWAISEDGLYYTFRLADMEGVDAELVARRLRTVIARRSDNPHKPILGAIDEIVAVTPAVVEIRLKAARPNFLDLLAQPEMAIIDKKLTPGPFAIASGNERSATLRPVNSGDEDALDADARHRRSIQLHGDHASLAVARYRDGKADLVLGGRLVDLGVAQAANLPVRDLKMDPVSGLFGLAAVERSGFAGNSENRRALAMAIDRDRITTSFNAPGLQPMTSLVASGTTELPQPAQPGWSTNALSARRTTAATIVRVWKLSHPDERAKVRIALPDRPGSRLLFALLRSDWAAIGVEAERVGMEADADLRLIDEVAPAQTATWYLRHFNCERNPVCSEAADAALEIARDTLHPVERAARIADADLRLAELVPYIPLAQPLRWSLVNARVTGFATNNRGVHPLNHLIEDPR